MRISADALLTSLALVKYFTYNVVFRVFCFDTYVTVSPLCLRHTVTIESIPRSVCVVFDLSREGGWKSISMAFHPKVDFLSAYIRTLNMNPVRFVVHFQIKNISYKINGFERRLATSTLRSNSLV